MQQISRFTLLVLFTAAIHANTTAAAPADDFHVLLDEHWATTQREQVYFRSDPDAFRMNGALPSFSADAYSRRQAYNESVLDRLNRIDLDSLTGQDRISYRVFRYERMTERDSYEQPDRYFPVNALFGYHTYFVNAPANMAFITSQDYERYLVSLADFPRYNAEHLKLLRDAAQRGYAQHCEAMSGYDMTISQLIVATPEDSPLFAPFTRFPAAITEDDRQRFAARGAELIRDSIMPGFRDLLEVFNNEYIPHCRKSAGIINVHRGREYYEYLLRYFTTTSMTPADIHELGMAELARIRDEMEAVRSQLGFAGGLRDFFEHLRNAPEFYAGSEKALLGNAALIAKTAEGELPRFFTRLPRGTYNIKSNPGRGAYYVAATGDGTTPGTYFIDTTDLRAAPLYALTALTLHEAVPGHHLQSALALELDLPAFRRSIYHSAFGEGWGLYSERLGLEMGMYTDPYDNFGRLSYEAWRATRLVVDTGLHMFGWNRLQAIDFMLKNTGLTRSEIENEVDRYITWPAQATSYKIGELRIRALRQQAEQALGTRFDIRRFHDVVVGNGSLPIAVLEEIVAEWIKAQAAEH
ncbi:DUF885 domain-containing protein [Woeseia oceani]|uniref:DUF885 domain-containing protein n=1 Tax=Woeseia oceani TaxID=1548547 RepID=A0A193LFB7_9GAMM|nr:DUF885 domain-containing protein [Woeseia oceani]ANO51158.1 hypothetical protein BA177_08025 [Woeseia oceani]